MSDFDTEKLLDGNLAGSPCREKFKEELLSQSAKALVRFQRIRNRIRIAGVFLAVCAVAAGAFFCGRFSAGGQGLNSVPGQGYAAKSSAEGFAGFVTGAEDGFWRDKMLASLQPKAGPPYKGYETNVDLLDRYRQYIRGRQVRQTDGGQVQY
jgi:hypothetical protein